ncbi:DNA-binding LacI/PurR family transcriptional regulator [Catenulispora sp. MAP12-49]|uniref:LacI family DNA-binding transcriptional regulator n=1 Tax=unclassified Catenulispora TaxID=414885 RepID=UPI0035152D0D
MKSTGQTTMRHVADRAGVSYQTVSRVINDAGGVAPETRERVLAAMRELNYRPSLAARALARARTDTIGLVLPFPVEVTFANAHFVQTVGGVDRVAAENDFSVLISSPDAEDLELSAHRRLVRRRAVDGVIVEAGMGDEGIGLLVEAGYPVVAIGHVALAVPSVRPDDESGAYGATQHLLALGHRRIALIAGGSPTNPTNLAQRARLRGCRRAAADAGVPLEEDLIAAGEFSLESGHRAAQTLFDRPDPPTAVLAFNDAMAIGAMRLLRERGISVPREVSVVGFDDTPTAALLTPSLTTVRIFSSELGQRAARTLIGMLRGTKVAPVPAVLPSQLVVRESTAPVRRE